MSSSVQWLAVAGVLAGGWMLLAGCGGSSRSAAVATPGATATGGQAVVAVQPPAPAFRAAAERGIVALPSAGEAGGVVVDVAQMRFRPEVIRIRSGQTVTWTFNDGDVPHTVTAFDQAFDSGVLRSGSFTLRFDVPGEYCYQCVLHPGANLCGRGQERQAGELPLLLSGGAMRPDTAGAGTAMLGGGGHMQGKVIVETQ